jgi:hypothetical protein
MKYQRNSTTGYMPVALIAAILVVSASGLTMGDMLPVAYATEPNDDDNNPTQVQTPSPSIGNDIGSGSDNDAGSVSSASEFSAQQSDGGVESAGSTNPACGQVVSGLVNLTANLHCSGDGIIVDESNTVINLNGFSITGPGQDSSKVAIMVSNADNVVVNGPGSLDNFQAGVLLTGTNGFEINSVILSNNEIGTFMTGAENAEIHQNMFQSNAIGVASHSSTAADVDSNLMSANLLAGITFVNTHGSSVTMNNIIGSQNGIFLDGQSSNNTVSANNVLDNMVDVNNANGLATNINGNEFTENNCETSNPSGLCIGR